MHPIPYIFKSMILAWKEWFIYKSQQAFRKEGMRLGCHKFTILKHIPHKICACSAAEWVNASSPGKWHRDHPQHWPAMFLPSENSNDRADPQVDFISINIHLCGRNSTICLVASQKYQLNYSILTMASTKRLQQDQSCAYSCKLSCNESICSGNFYTISLTSNT